MFYSAFSLLLVVLISALGSVHSSESPPLQLVKKIRPEKENEVIDVVLLLDESASLSKEDFKSAVSACEDLLKQLRMADTRFAVIPYSTTSRLLVPFTTDRTAVLEGIHKVTRSHSLDTSPKIGFEEAKTTFSYFKRANARKVIFWPTDANYSSDQVPSQVADILKFTEDIVIVGLGIGQFNRDLLEAISSHGYAFSENDFQKVLISFADLVKEKSSYHSRELVMVPRLADVPLDVTHALRLKLRLNNEGRETIAKGSLLRFSAGDYLIKTNVPVHQAIHPQDHIDLDIELPVSGSAGFKSIPEFIEVSIVDADNNPIYTEHDRIRLSTEYMVGSLVKWNSPDPEIPAANILIFGCIGAGKSSLINSILTSLSTEVQQTAVIGGSESHVTSTIARFRLWNIPGIPKVRVNFWDTWGLTASNYDPAFLNELLHGTIRPGFHMKDRFVQRDTIVNEAWMGNARERAMHAALVVVPQGIAADKELAESMKTAFKDMVEHGLNPLVVVTHIDERDIKEHPQLRKQVANVFRIPENRVHLIQNYVTQAEKNFTIDRNSLVILDEVLKLAHQRIGLLKSNDEATLDDVDEESNYYQKQGKQGKKSSKEGTSKETRMILGFSFIAFVILGTLFVGIRMGKKSNNPVPPVPVERSPSRTSSRSPSRSSSRGRTRSRSPIKEKTQSEVTKKTSVQPQVEEVEEEEEEEEETVVPETETVKDEEVGETSEVDENTGWEFVEDQHEEVAPIEPVEPLTQDDDVVAEDDENDKADVEVKFNFLTKIFEVKRDNTVADLLEASISYYCIPNSVRNDYCLVDQLGNPLALTDRVYDPQERLVYYLQRQGARDE